MNTRILQSLIALALIASVHQAVAQSTAFTYQGRLTSDTIAANGSYDLTFSLFSVSSGAGQVGSTYPAPATPVSNGLFTVTLDFGANFPGANRWLEISVRTNGGGAYTTLSPRQAITATPYAIFATTSGTASNLVNGSVVKSLNGLRDDVTLAAGTNMTITPNGNTLTLAAVGAGGSGIWSVLNNNAYYNAGNVGIGTTTPSTYGHGGTARILEVNNSGTTLNSQAHLMLYTGVSSLADSSMGTVTWAQPGGMAAYIGAQTRSTTPNMPSAMLTFGTRKSGEAAASRKMVITEDGNVGIGTSTPANRLDVAGNVGITGNETFGAATRQMLTLYNSGIYNYGIGVQNSALYQRAGLSGGFAWYQGGSHADGRFDAGGGNTLMTLDENGDLQVNAVNSSGGNAVWGNNPNGTGVAGTSSSGSGVYGRSTSGFGVFGESSGAGLSGVYGTTHSSSGSGVIGETYVGNFAGTPYGAGVTGIAHHGGVGIHGIAVDGTYDAGIFDGAVWVSTDLAVMGAKSFKIDHPLDPANKYLLHASIESPDVKNLYDGNITTDASGEAIVTLPTYFETLNRDFRYQLTVIGQFAQAIVSSEIKDNQFAIKTDKPNVKVSWQVTGIRQDAYMKAHPMVVEQDKPANERGTYQHPELFGQPEEKGLSWSRNPELWKRLKKERVEQAALPKP